LTVSCLSHFSTNGISLQSGKAEKNYRDQGRLTFLAPLHQIPSRQIALLFTARTYDSKVSHSESLIRSAVQFNLVKIKPMESEAEHRFRLTEADETNNNAQFQDSRLVWSSTSASDSDKVVLTRTELYMES